MKFPFHNVYFEIADSANYLQYISTAKQQATTLANAKLLCVYIEPNYE